MELAIGDLEWVDELAATMAAHMLVQCPTPFERHHLLRLLSEAQFGLEFQCVDSGALGSLLSVGSWPHYHMPRTSTTMMDRMRPRHVVW